MKKEEFKLNRKNPLTEKGMKQMGMEKENESLSDCGKEAEDGIWYHNSKVKEFIKKLKEEFKLYRTNKQGELFITQRDRWFLKRIDKLTGDKLI